VKEKLIDNFDRPHDGDNRRQQRGLLAEMATGAGQRMAGL